MSFALRSYSGKAQASQLQANITNSSTTFSIASGDSSSWTELGGSNLGSSGQFVCVIGYGGSNEEKVLCSGITGTTVTIATSGRGYDGTTASSHSSGDIVMPVFSAQEAYEANWAANKTIGQITLPGQLLVGTGDKLMSALGKGLDSSVLSVSSGSVGWSAAGASGYALVSTGTGVTWRKTVPAMLSSYRAAGTPPITGGAWTAAPLDTTNFVLGASGDQPTCDYTTNKGRFTINLAGVWRIGGTVTVFPAASMVYVQSRIVAGSSIASGTIYPGPKCVADTGLGGSSAQSVDVVLNVGDKVELQALTNVTTTFAVGNAPVYTYCTLTYLGPST